MSFALLLAKNVHLGIDEFHISGRPWQPRTPSAIGWPPLATLDSGTAFLSQGHLSFLLNFLLSALKDTWYRSLFQRYAKWPCWTGSDSLWAAHLRWRLSTVRHWRRNPFLPTSSTGVDLSFFFHEDSCWSASKTLFAECPNDDGCHERLLLQASGRTNSATAVDESLDESVRRASHDVELIVEWESGTCIFSCLVLPFHW